MSRMPQLPESAHTDSSHGVSDPRAQVPQENASCASPHPAFPGTCSSSSLPTGLPRGLPPAFPGMAAQLSASRPHGSFSSTPLPVQAPRSVLGWVLVLSIQEPKCF